MRGRPRDPANLLAPASLRPLCLAAIFFAACAHPPPPRPARVATEPLKIVASPGPWGPRAEAYDAETLFRRGNAELSAGRHAAATPLYARLLTEFPGTRFTVPALYNAGLAAEGEQHPAEALRRYRQLLLLDPQAAAEAAGLPGAVEPVAAPPAPPSPRDLQDARFRLLRCLIDVDPAAAARRYADLLLRRDLSPADRVEAAAYRGHALLAAGDLQAAEAALTQALTRAREAVGDVSGVEDHAALAECDLGEVALRHFRALTPRLPQAQLERDLEDKARLLLSAQGRLITVIRRRHPRYASTAGFALGSLYRELYDAILEAPLPPELDSPEKAVAYRDVLRGRLRGLLQRARKIHERNLQLADYLGDPGSSQRSAEQLAELDRLLEGPAPTSP